MYEWEVCSHQISRNSLGYAFHIGSVLTGDLKSLHNRIEDAVVQADEVDGRMLQFEGGLSITGKCLYLLYIFKKISTDNFVQLHILFHVLIYRYLMLSVQTLISNI